MNRRSTCWSGYASLCWLLISGCASWEHTKRDIVQPLNRLVHADYPRAIQARDESKVLGLFSADLQDWARTDLATILDRFESIDRARCVIHDSTAPNANGTVRLDCVLRCDGRGDGEPLTWEQERVLHAQRVEGAWRITAVETGLTTLARRRLQFREAAAERGLVATSRSRGMPDRAGRPQTYLGSSGVAIGDIDGDQRDDVLLLSGDRLRLFHNTGGAFLEVTQAHGITTPATGECRCAYFADIDNDGDADLFVGMMNHANLLFVNDGTGRYQQISEARSGLRSIGHTASACFGDFDRDGDLDLFVVNGNNMGQVAPKPPYAASNGHANQYFRNDGDGHFTETTQAAGLGNTGWGLACAVSDYDQDGDLDLFLANDVGLDVLYRNRGDGSFEDVSQAAGMVFHGSSMSADFADVNGDGWPDLYVAGMASNSRWILKQPGFPKPVSWLIGLFFQNFIHQVMWEMFHGNRLYLNQGDGTFTEVSTQTRSYWLGWAWSSVFLDFDNDGRQDIYATNGFWTGEQPQDC